MSYMAVDATTIYSLGCITGAVVVGVMAAMRRPRRVISQTYSPPKCSHEWQQSHDGDELYCRRCASVIAFDSSQRWPPKSSQPSPETWR